MLSAYFRKNVVPTNFQTFEIKRVRIDFTRSGWRQFAKLNQALGARFIRAFILKSELAAYISAHEASGVYFDTECQEVRYEGGVYLSLRKMQGVWYITDIFCTEGPAAFEPVYFWTQIKRGISFVLAQMLIGWRTLTETAAEKRVGA